MKKIISFILSLCIVISLCACGSDISSNKENNETKSAYDEIRLGATIETEFADVSFTDIKISNTIQNKNLDINLKDESDKVYFVLYGKVTNKGTDALSLWGLYVDVLIDDTYTYDVDVVLEEREPLVPLDSEEFLMYVSLPDEVFNACEKYSVKIGFNDWFHTLETEIEKCQYKFEINGTVDEFGSAESVEDFQSLREYVNTLLADSSYEDLLTNVDTSREVIYITSVYKMEVPCDNGETFNFLPKMGIYTPDEFDNSVSAEFQFYVSNNGDAKVSRYYGFENLIIESENGVYEHNNQRINHADTGEWGENTWGRRTEFRINDLEVANQLLNVLDGDNIKISFDAVTLDAAAGKNNEVDHIVFECTDNVKDSMTDLCNIFIDIESKGFTFK